MKHVSHGPAHNQASQALVNILFVPCLTNSRRHAKHVWVPLIARDAIDDSISTKAHPVEALELIN